MAQTVERGKRARESEARCEGGDSCTVARKIYVIWSAYGWAWGCSTVGGRRCGLVQSIVIVVPLIFLIFFSFVFRSLGTISTTVVVWIKKYTPYIICFILRSRFPS